MKLTTAEKSALLLAALDRHDKLRKIADDPQAHPEVRSIAADQLDALFSANQKIQDLDVGDDYSHIDRHLHITEKVA